MTRRNLFLSHVVVALGLTIVGLAAATQYVASALAYQPQLGAPLTVAAGLRVYVPWAWLVWAYHFEPYAPRVFDVASWITYGTFFLTFAAAVLLAVVRMKRTPNSDAYGSAKWATTPQLERAGLLGDDGVVLCQTNDARFSAQPDGKGGLKWTMGRSGRLLRHDGPEHVFVFAPTRSGKGVGIVLPTLLAWRHSALIYDIKKELWTGTAGWRRKFSHCWRFEPTAHDSIRFNPLLEIRRGAFEVKDTQNVADILVDPTGEKESKDHWQTTAHKLLVGAILHVLYAGADKSLTGVLRFLTDPSRTQFDTLQLMLNTAHLPTGPHPVVAGAAREMLNKSENELSGVFSTATSCLGLYDDPIISRNTSASDFRITDLMNAERPVSLYLVVPPSDLARTRPIIRLMLNQIGRRLTESMEFGDKKAYRHRMLVLLDEFPSLGRLDFFETALAFVAGYGLKCLLIAQSLNQLEKAYGPKNSILDNCHIRVTYTANDDHTAKRISDLLGQGTQTKRQLNFSGSRLGPWLGNVSENEQEYARPLLTPGEVLQLPFDDAIVLAGGVSPYRGRKLMYYLDNRFKARAWLPTPDAPADQTGELLPEPPAHDWSALPVPAARPTVGSAAVSHANGPGTPSPAPTTMPAVDAVANGISHANGVSMAGAVVSHANADAPISHANGDGESASAAGTIEALMGSYVPPATTEGDLPL